jgi:hypothetical protein
MQSTPASSSDSPAKPARAPMQSVAQALDTLLDAAVLIAVAVDSVPDVSLPAEMATLIGDIFTGLSKAVSKGESVSSECF